LGREAALAAGTEDLRQTRGRDTLSTAGKSILMVDDDQEIRELLQTYLIHAGFQVHA